MAEKHSRMIFVNIAVRDLKKSMDFFTALGFEFNLAFTDEKAACMIINKEAYVMLLTDPFFKGFIKNEPCDPTRSTEAILALSCERKGEVDEMVQKALAAGGRRAMDPSDQGFMYYASFYDLDGHHWEVIWMDPSTVQ